MQRRLDQRLAVGSGVKRVAGEREFEPPEFTSTEDAAQRFVRDEAPQHPINPLLLDRRHGPCRMRKNSSGLDLERGSDKPPRAPARLVETGFGKRRRSVPENGADCRQRGGLRPHASAIDSFSARSAAVSASTISSSASPANILSIL